MENNLFATSLNSASLNSPILLQSKQHGNTFACLSRVTIQCPSSLYRSRFKFGEDITGAWVVLLVFSRCCIMCLQPEPSVPYSSLVLFVVARDRLSRLAVCGGNTSCSWAVWPSCVSSVQMVAALEVCVVSAAQVGELTPLSARTSGSSASCSGIRTRGTPTDQSSQTILPLGADQRTTTLLYSRNRVVELTC